MNRFKLLLVSLVALAGSFSAQSQTYIKTNALYWLALLPNAQVETYLSERLTFQGEINGSLWADIGEGRPMRGVQLISGIRYYLKAAFEGFYVGGDLSFDLYDVSKWNYWYSTDWISIQHGMGYYVGATFGYQKPIGERWNMDFFVGGGWHLGKYWGERFYNDGTSEAYVLWNGSGEWIPYKAGVTFSYRLTSSGRGNSSSGKRCK
ncbi:MAG: DUF3575 domain-containing protein [Rikenellaceae bacterium]